jgi:hypothetical protein
MVAIFHPKPAAPSASAPVRVRREDGGVDLVRIVDSWTSYASGIAMLTVRHAPFGLQSFTVRADQVLTDDEPDDRHDATQCDLDCVEHAAERRAARWADGWGE